MCAIRISSLYKKEEIWHINYNNKIPSISTDKDSAFLSLRIMIILMQCVRVCLLPTAVYQSVFVTNCSVSECVCYQLQCVRVCLLPTAVVRVCENNILSTNLITV
jgi:hypothetical protein